MVNEIEIEKFYRAAAPIRAPCEGCGTVAPHVLTDGSGNYLCRTCATRAAVAAVAGQFAVGAERGAECHVKHGAYFPAVRVEIATGRGFCDKCYSQIIDAVRNGIAE